MQVPSMRDLELGPVRAVILTTQRTGSSFLVDCLGSHPEIECGSEILNGQPDSPIAAARGPFRYVVKFARIARRGAWLPSYRLERFYGAGGAPVRCFKAMYNHLARPFVLQYLLEHKEIRVIHLARQNLLKVYVSTQLMQKRRQLQATGPVAPLWIRVDPQRAIAAMRMARMRRERYEKLFARHAKLTLTYESLFDGAQLNAGAARRVCDFLGVSYHPMKSRFVKLNPQSLHDMVTNYDELAATVSRTEFAYMLA